MKKIHIIGFILITAVLVIGAFFWIGYLRTQSALKHETDRWAVIEDVNGDRIAVEPVSSEVWVQLVQMQQNGSRLFIGSIVEEYDNKWGFRFKPENVTIAEFTAEGLQATIRYISENLDYWLGGWAYVSAKVMEVYSE
ncbi:MAG: hypothetical protein ACE5FT_07135 [Candidatus Nanoarchaeia archaeon]